MSYATANDDIRPQQRVSAEYLKTACKHLNESIDTKEYMLPDRMQANKDVAVRVFREIPRFTLREGNFEKLADMKKFGIYFHRSYSIIMQLGLEKMQDIIKNDMVAGWDSMNLHGCVYGSFELFRILKNSVSSIGEESWRAALRLRLEEKLVCSKKVTDDIQRVHDAYNNFVPLTNYTATPNGSYDSLYRTRELFPQSRDINMTYSRLRGHTKTYIENIESLLGILKNHDYESEEITYEYLNYTNGLWQASVEYDNELKLYESLMIRQPMHRIINRMRIFNNFKVRGFQKIQIRNDQPYSNDIYDLQMTGLKINMIRQHIAFESITNTIAKYANNLSKGTYASKLSYANMLTNDGVKKIVDEYITDYFPTTQIWLRQLLFDFTDLTQLHCKMYTRAISDPLLKAFYAKLYDHYKKTNDWERSAMKTYFHFFNDKTLCSKLVTGTFIRGGTCIGAYRRRLKPFKDSIILPKVTLFKESIDRLEYFLHTTRLKGNVFRYFTVFRN